MHFTVKKAALTDAGTRKRVNQDALLIRTAKSARFGRVCFAVMCDGLGGLSNGEIASNTFVRRMEQWFTDDFVTMMERAHSCHMDLQQCLHRCEVMWHAIVMEQNEEIAALGRSFGLNMGTTAVVFLLIGQSYMVMNVGDSRLYLAQSRTFRQLTRDHSLVQMLLDRGVMNNDQALISDKKSVLLQCIGASHCVIPDFCKGTICQDASVLICTDGFWRRLHSDEIREAISPDAVQDEQAMNENLQSLVTTVKNRGERDNISVIYFRLTADDPASDTFSFLKRQAEALC